MMFCSHIECPFVAVYLLAGCASKCGMLLVILRRFTVLVFPSVLVDPIELDCSARVGAHIKCQLSVK